MYWKGGESLFKNKVKPAALNLNNLIVTQSSLSQSQSLAVVYVFCGGPNIFFFLKLEFQLPRSPIAIKEQFKKENNKQAPVFSTVGRRFADLSYLVSWY